MSYLDTLHKGANDHLDYEFDFSRWLPDEDRITGADASVSGDGSLIVTQVQHDEQIVQVWLNGGLPNSQSLLTVNITTLGGRLKQVSVRVQIREAS